MVLQILYCFKKISKSNNILESRRFGQCICMKQVSPCEFVSHLFSVFSLPLRLTLFSTMLLHISWHPPNAAHLSQQHQLGCNPQTLCRLQVAESAPCKCLNWLKRIEVLPLSLSVSVSFSPVHFLTQLKGKRMLQAESSGRLRMYVMRFSFSQGYS